MSDHLHHCSFELQRVNHCGRVLVTIIACTSIGTYLLSQKWLLTCLLTHVILRHVMQS